MVTDKLEKAYDALGIKDGEQIDFSSARDFRDKLNFAVQPVITNFAIKAQISVINWLIGRCESQFVRAWLIQERELLSRIGGPIDRDGGNLL